MKKMLLSLTALSVLFVCHAQEANLSLILEKGKVYKQVLESKQSLNQEFMGQKNELQMNVSTTSSFLINNIDNNTYDFEVKFEKLVMSIQSAQGVIEFSSEMKAENDVISTLLSEMLHKPFQVVVANSGRVTNVNGIDKIFADAVSTHKNLSVAQIDQIKAQVLKSFGNDIFKSNLSLTTGVLSNKSVSVGTKWTGRSRILMGSYMTSRPEYELVEMTSGIATIKGNGIYATQNKNEFVTSYGVPMKYDLTGTIISEVKVDRSTGWIITAKIDQDIKGNAFIEKSDQLPDGMTVPTTIKGSLNVTN